jgi:uncharacterized SAM-binding protein YcdF (DUF218 family)
MDIYLIYIIKTLILPVASLLTLGLIGLFLFRRSDFSMLLIGFSLIMLSMLSLPVVSVFLAGIQEKYPAVDDAVLSDFSAQAIVILGGGLKIPAPEYPLQLTVSNTTLERIRYGAFLAQKMQLPILVSGGKVFSDRPLAEADVMAQVLQQEFKQSVQWREQNSRNTAENALYAANMLKSVGVNRIILVTHAFHMSRAMEQFQQQNLEILPAPTVFFSKVLSYKILDFIPSAEALQKSTLMIHEMIGQLWYKIRY